MAIIAFGKGRYPVTTEETKKLIHRFYDEMWNRGDFTKADEIVSDDLSVHALGPGVALDSAEAVRESILSFRTAFPYSHVTIKDLLVDRDKVAVRFALRGTHRSEFRGIPPTGKPVTIEGIGIFRVAKGRLAEAWSAADDLSTMQQLGLMPPIGQVKEKAA